MEIYPSVMGKSQKEIDKLLKKLDGVSKYLHLDIADGKFVPNKSLWFNFKLSKNFGYAAHLMIKNPLSWVKKHGSKVDIIIFHLEAVKDVTEDVRSVINLVKKKKRKVGIALKPETSVAKLKGYLPMVDYVLVLTVHPGFYGAKYLKEPLKKIKQIKKLNRLLVILFFNLFLRQ